MWRHMCAYVRAHVCAYVCVCVCVMSGLSIFSRYKLCSLIHISYIPVKSCFFLSSVTIFVFISSQVMWHDRKRSIHAFNQSRQSSLK